MTYAYYPFGLYTEQSTTNFMCLTQEGRECDDLVKRDGVSTDISIFIALNIDTPRESEIVKLICFEFRCRVEDPNREHYGCGVVRVHSVSSFQRNLNM